MVDRKNIDSSLFLLTRLFGAKLGVRGAPSEPPYPATNGGTQWRVRGPDLEGEDLTLGCEAFQGHLGKRVLILTVF